MHRESLQNNVERIRKGCDRAPGHAFEIHTQRVLRRQIAQIEDKQKTLQGRLESDFPGYD